MFERRHTKRGLKATRLTVASAGSKLRKQHAREHTDDLLAPTRSKTHETLHTSENALKPNTRNTGSTPTQETKVAAAARSLVALAESSESER